jgi:DNA processing protein
MRREVIPTSDRCALTWPFMDDLAAWLTLLRAPGLHAGTLAPLLQHFPNATALVSASPATLRAAGVRASLIDWLCSSPRQPVESAVAADLRWLERDSHHFVAWGSPAYPQLLARIADAPVGLYVRGSPDVLAQPQLAIVGSRNPTPSGRETAQSFAANLVQRGLTITSGLAIGIDTASHRGALDVPLEGPHNLVTIAVCGTGLDVDYPRANAALAREIAMHGALVSEFPLGTPAYKDNFPRRNRIISGMSLGTLVVEAALRSGSLITARLAAEQGREVFAIPSSIHNPLARGCHELIRQGAKLVETPNDIFEDIFTEMHALAGAPLLARELAGRRREAPEAAANPLWPLDKEYEILLDALGFEPTGVDLAVVRTGLRADEVASMLLILELAGRVESYPGGLYVRARPKAVK